MAIRSSKAPDLEPLAGPPGGVFGRDVERSVRANQGGRILSALGTEAPFLSARELHEAELAGLVPPMPPIGLVTEGGAPTRHDLLVERRRAIARLRQARVMEAKRPGTGVTTTASLARGPVSECPRCGRVGGVLEGSGRAARCADGCA